MGKLDLGTVNVAKNKIYQINIMKFHTDITRLRPNNILLVL